MPETLVLLHGFSGTRRAWDGLIARLDRERYRPLALDLPGHGEAAAQAVRGAEQERAGQARAGAGLSRARAVAERITFESCVERVLRASPERFALCGYSLGGRVALHVALAAPERVTRLVLVSTSAGIEDAAERERRRAADGRLADELERIPFEEFIERWRSQPLFAGDPPEVDRLAREDQRRNDPHALAHALRGIGAGEMPPLWDRLAELTMPVTVVAGERDAKYRALGERMAGCLPDGRLVVIGGGHALALENPAGLAHPLID
jgi:2-succinyl-6-hydroxy-2,4-cyclohexadiene-1-carboxylate synthase